MAGLGYLTQVLFPPRPSRGFWLLSPQVLVSYYLPDEEVPVATAMLCLTGIGECVPTPGEEGWVSLPPVLDGSTQHARSHSPSKLRHC